MQQTEAKCFPCKEALRAYQQPSCQMMSHQTAAAMLGTWSELSQCSPRMHQTRKQPPQGMFSLATMTACLQTLQKAPRSSVGIGRRLSWPFHRADKKAPAPLLAGHQFPLHWVMTVIVPMMMKEQEAPNTWQRACWQH